MQNKIYKCDVCGALKDQPRTTREGKPFMGCPNWKDEAHQKARDEYKKAHQRQGFDPNGFRPQKEQTEEKLGAKTEPKSVDGIMILADNFEALRKDFNDRMDNMAAYISKENKKLQDGMDVVQDKLNKLSILDQE